MIISAFSDGPKILADEEVRAERIRQLTLPHVAPLAAFAQQIRSERGSAYSVPDFDPWDGGVDAEVLYVLEAPGPKTVATGFVSRNNPDESALNFFRANVEAGIPRTRTVSWNIIPWTLSDRQGRVRSPKQEDISSGIPYLERLLALLPRLCAVVLVGRSAERAAPHLMTQRRSFDLFVAPHPSPQFVNRFPENRERLASALRAVAAKLRAGDPAF